MVSFKITSAWCVLGGVLCLVAIAVDAGWVSAPFDYRLRFPHARRWQAVLLTKKDTFLTRDEYCQLVYSALEGLPRFQTDPKCEIRLLPPAILKPKPMWTGKQVISSLLFGLTGDLPDPACYMDVDRKAKVSAKMWGESDKMPGREPTPGDDSARPPRL